MAIRSASGRVRRLGPDEACQQVGKATIDELHELADEHVCS